MFTILILEYSQRSRSKCKNDDTIVSFKVIDFIPTSFIENTGIGEINVKLKVLTQSTANIGFNDRYNAPEVLLANADDIKTSRLVPYT